MPQFELAGGVQLEVAEDHSPEFKGGWNSGLFAGYDSGAVLWAASPPLARWLSEPAAAGSAAAPGPAVELGCGAGLVALALAASGRGLTHVIATDGDEPVLDRVTRPNFEANAASVREGVQLRAVPLGWGDDAAAQQLINRELGGQRTTLIVGADVMYEQEKHAALAQTILALARPPPLAATDEQAAAPAAAPWRCRLIMAWEVRHIDHFEAFFPLLTEALVEGPKLVHTVATPGPFAEYGVEDDGEVRIVECILGAAG